MVNYSIPRAMERIQRLKTEAALPENTKMAKKQEIQKKMKSLDVEVGSILSRVGNPNPESVQFLDKNPNPLF